MTSTERKSGGRVRRCRQPPRLPASAAGEHPLRTRPPTELKSGADNPPACPAPNLAGTSATSPAAGGLPPTTPQLARSRRRRALLHLHSLIRKGPCKYVLTPHLQVHGRLPRVLQELRHGALRLRPDPPLQGADCARSAPGEGRDHHLHYDRLRARRQAAQLRDDQRGARHPRHLQPAHRGRGKPRQYLHQPGGGERRRGGEGEGGGGVQHQLPTNPPPHHNQTKPNQTYQTRCTSPPTATSRPS
jgi:hypothetical protein